MAAPAFSSFTAHTGNPTTSASITLPTTAANDILILVAVNAGSTTALTPGGTYNGGAWNATGLAAAMTSSWGGSWWSRCTGNHSGQTVTVATATDSCSAAVIRVTDALSSASPLDTNTSATTLTANGMTLTGFSTTGPDRLIVFANAADDNIASSAQAAVNVTLTERGEANSTGGADSHVDISTGTLAAAGSTGNFSGTHASTLSKRLMAFALKPLPATVERSAAIAATADVSATGRVAPFGTSANASAIFDARYVSGSDGDPIAAWNDGSGLGRNASQGTGASQPTLQTNEMNSLPVLRFDGSDDWMTATGVVNDQAARTIFIVARSISVTSADSFYGLNSAARLQQGASPNIQWATTEAGGVVNLSTGAAAGVTFVATIRFNSASSADRYLDDAAAQNFDPSDGYQSGGQGLAIGARTLTGTAPANADIAALYVFDSALSDADLDLVRDGLMTRWMGATVHERSAAIDATAAISSSGVVEAPTVERSAAISATAAIASSGVRWHDGQTATNKLAFAPPDTTGYTTRTITAAESAKGRTELILDLDPATDYVIEAPHVIKHAVQVNGGRNIVWIGGHIEVMEVGDLPDDSVTEGLVFSGSSGTARTIHVEGLWINGADLGKCLTVNDDDAVLQGGHLRLVDSKPFNTDSWGNPPAPAPDNGSDFGTQAFAWTGWNHADGIAAIDHAGLFMDRCTIKAGGAAIHNGFAAATANGQLRRTNLEPERHALREGPYSFSTTFTPVTTRADFEAGVDSWVTAGGSSVSHDTATEITGTGSLQISDTTTLETDRFTCIAQRSFGSAQDWSADGGAIRCKVRLDDGGGGYPMARLDITTDSSVFATTREGWWEGTPRKLTTGVAVDVVGEYPAAVLSAIRKVRVVLLTDGTADTHQITVDDIATGSGKTTVTYEGPALDWPGKWGLYTDEEYRVHDVYAGPAEDDNLFKDGVNYQVRYWDGDEYVLDPPPGGAELDDFMRYPSGNPTLGSDGNGTFVQYSERVLNETGTAGAKIYEGPPPGGDFCPEGLAGVNYVPAGYLAEQARTASVSATAAITSSGARVVTRSAAISATAAIASVGQRDLQRQATVSATGAIAASGTFWTTFERSAAIDAAGAIASSATFWSTLERTAAIAATAGIATAPERELLRAAAIAATAAIAANGEIEGQTPVHNRSASFDATAAIESAATFWSTLERAAAVSATASIASAPQRDLLRAASLVATAAIATDSERALQRAAVIAATALVTTAGQSELSRSAAIDATALITAAGAGALAWTYHGTGTGTYSGEGTMTYGDDPGFSYAGGAIWTYHGDD